MTYLDNLYRYLRQHPAAQRFTFINRWLLAAGFIPTGLVKVLNQPFTQLGPDSPVGLFFQVFYQASEWYIAIGLFQMIAGILLLIPALAHIGAFLFYPIIFNILLITIGVGFTGTPYIVGMMLLANTWLVIWEYPRIKKILQPGDYISFGIFTKLESTAYVLAVASILVFFMTVRSFLGSQWVTYALISGGIAFLIWCGAMIQLWFNNRQEAV